VLYIGLSLRPRKFYTPGGRAGGRRATGGARPEPPHSGGISGGSAPGCHGHPKILSLRGGGSGGLAPGCHGHLNPPFGRRFQMSAPRCRAPETHPEGGGGSGGTWHPHIYIYIYIYIWSPRLPRFVSAVFCQHAIQMSIYRLLLTTARGARKMFHELVQFTKSHITKE